MRINHIAVEAADFDNTVAWYKDFFGATQTWIMDKDFSATTLQRNPGIKRLCELVVRSEHTYAADDLLRFHIIERSHGTDIQAAEHGPQFQHICIELPDDGPDIRAYHKRWRVLYQSGKYKFALPAQPTDIHEGLFETNFYALDVNGLEYEFVQ